MKAVAPEPEAAEAGAAARGAAEPPALAEAAEAEADVPETEAGAQVRKENCNSRLQTCRRQRPEGQSQEMDQNRVSCLTAGFGF